MPKVAVTINSQQFGLVAAVVEHTLLAPLPVLRLFEAHIADEELREHLKVRERQFSSLHTRRCVLKCIAGLAHAVLWLAPPPPHIFPRETQLRSGQTNQS